MLIILIKNKENGVVEETRPIKSPDKKSTKGIVDIFKKIIKQGKTIDIEFNDDVEPREKEIWEVAKKLAETKMFCEDLSNCNSFLMKQLIDHGIFQLPYFYPAAISKSFVRDTEDDKFTVNVLDDGRMELFYGLKVEVMKISKKNGIKRH